MYNNNKILGIIPARAGSKGIKDKNIKNLKGKPLIAYSIEAGRKSQYIDDVVVSTDGELIAKIAEEYGAFVPFLRPVELASDEAKTIDAVIHCIEGLRKIGMEYDYVVLLQPTQPLRTSYHIDEAIELIIDNNAENLVSVCKVKEHPILMRTINSENKLENLINMSSTQRRQDFKPFYKVNGAIYINKINENLNNGTSLNDNKLPYIMEEKYSVDIDEMLDFEVAEILLSK